LIRRAIASLAVIAAAATGIVMSTGAPASASASGCTSAPGNVFATNCIAVTGRSLTVSRVRSKYNVGFPVTNVCNPHSRFKYKREGASSYTKFVLASRSCGLGSAWLDWFPHFRFADKSRLCTQQLNDQTHGSYANYACINIIR
jgi:hypothetical protein